ncbi:hypothetical protein ABTX81_35395 [Kitasatospora sp. NPDC097605]|uniref:hypothetical protein n=1 Tax=Kitasatospora sp. NPDC097605 TaxID=3157226 RepID=UPI003326E480
MAARPDFDRIADELYTLAPGDFTAARNRHADELRKTDRRLAERIRALRRPTQAAWAANLLTRHHGDFVADLLALGQELRAAQEQLAGDRLRMLGERRRQLVRELLVRAQRAAAEAGHPLGTEAVDGVERTLSAALADPRAAEAFAAGRLVVPLEPVAWPGTASDATADGAGQAAGGSAIPGRERSARVRGARLPSRSAVGAGGTAKRAEAEPPRREREREREQAREQARQEAGAAEVAGREAAGRRDAAERVLADAESARRQARDEAEQARRALSAAERREERARADLARAEEQVLAAREEAGQAREVASRASEAALAAAGRLHELESGGRRER